VVQLAGMSAWLLSRTRAPHRPHAPPDTVHASCLHACTQVIYGGSHYQGPLSDVWVFNPDQGGWTQPSVSGEAPGAREMHSGCMVDTHTMLVYGGRASDGRWVRLGRVRCI
jgi:hypothetical protein